MAADERLQRLIREAREQRHSLPSEELLAELRRTGSGCATHEGLLTWRAGPRIYEPITPGGMVQVQRPDGAFDVVEPGIYWEVDIRCPLCWQIEGRTRLVLWRERLTGLQEALIHDQ